MVDAQKVGILAYGSLISDPGAELTAVHVDTINDVMTPFSVEFARKSETRGGAPTLVPHEKGCQVRANVLVLNTTIIDATDRLYRRETHQIGCTTRYRHAERPGLNRVVINRLGNFSGLASVLYTQIGANIRDLNPLQLAQLAIASVAKATAGQDGISYLMNAISHGIETPMTAAYSENVRNLTGARTLLEALNRVKVGGAKQ